MAEAINDMNKDIDLNSSIDILITSENLDPSSFQSSCVGPRPVFREISNSELTNTLEEDISPAIKGWSADLTDLPPISHERIHKYLVLGKSLDNKPRGADKHKILGYQLFKENYVKKIRVKAKVNIERLCFLVKCFSAASMKKDKYTIYIHLCQQTGDIFYAKCSCKAGAGGCCKHVAAVLYQLVEYRALNLKTVPDDKTCTDVLQKWHVPGEAANLDPIKFSDLTFAKANINKDTGNSRKRPLVTGNRNFCATPLFAHVPTEEKIKKLSDDLISSGKGTIFGILLKGNEYKPSTFFNTSIKQYHADKENTVKYSKVNRNVIQKMFYKIESNSIYLTKLTLGQQKFVSDNLLVDENIMVDIEEATLGQATSNRWYEERRKRITASNFGSVINRRPTVYPKSLLQKLLQMSKFKSNACDWGRDNESIAIEKYKEITGNSVTECGFVVNPKCPWLGASPDGIILGKDGVIKILEVKCSFSKKDISIKDSCADKTFCLKLENDCPMLKPNHVYYFQCQGLMAITETMETDFVVYTNVDTHVETIKFQKEQWEGCFLPRLTKFYFEFMMDKVFSN